MSKVVSLDITRRDFAATLSAIAGATAVAGVAAAASPAEGATPSAWEAFSLADLDGMHEALTKADDAILAIYNQPRTDIDGPAGDFLFQRMEALRSTYNGIVDAARAREAVTVQDIDPRWRILARAAAGLDNRDMERELIAALMARHQTA